MTISSTTLRKEYNGNGVTTSFSFPYRFLANADLLVYVDDELQTLTTDYTVTGAGGPSGGSVVFGVAPPSGTGNVVVINSPEIVQELDLVENDPMPAESLETAYDRLTLIAQRLDDRVTRSMTLSDSYAADVDLTLPSPEANNVLAWNSAADALVNMAPADFATVLTYANRKAETFTGDGTTTDFTLESTPATVANTDVDIGGVAQVPGVDYVLLADNVTLQFSAAPPNGELVSVKYGQAAEQGRDDADTVYFAPAGTDAVSRSVQAVLRATRIRVRDFGAVGDGVTDDTLAIQKAINYAETLVANRFLSGAAVDFAHGTYLVSSTLTVDTSNIYLVGDSPGSAVLYAPSSNFDLVHFDGSALSLYQVGMRNVRFYTPGNATAGCHLRVRKAINAIFDNVTFVGWYDGIVLDGCGKTMFNNTILSQENRTNGTSPRYAIDFASTSNNNSDIHFSNYQITFDTVNQNTVNSVRIQGSDGIYFTNGHQHGAVQLNPSSVTCASVFWSNVYFDTSTAGNLKFNGTSTSYRNFWFNNCYFRDSGGTAVAFDASSTVENVFFTGCKISDHANSGIVCTSSVNDLLISGSLFKDNNSANGASSGDLIIRGRATIVGTNFFGGGAAGTAVTFAAASVNSQMVGCNVATTTAGTRISDSGTNTRVRSTWGWTLKSSGQATITNPATTVTVNHGLSKTPSITEISLTYNDAAAGVTRMWPSGVTSTQFTINVNATPTTSALIGWYVDAEK